MKIRIVKASEPTFWYADKIGEVFEVTGDAYGDYFVNYGGRSFKYIVDTVDCEEINKTEAVGMENAVQKRGSLMKKVVPTDDYHETLTFTENADGTFSLNFKQMPALVHVSYDGNGTFDQTFIHGEYKAEAQRIKIESAVGELTSYTIDSLAVLKPVEQLVTLHAGETVMPAEKLTSHKATKSPQEIRDDIVAQAKRDVAGSVFAEYYVNKEKRAVTCLMRGYGSEKLIAKGIAKCDPSDCFNAHIGKAISLRRALGLEVPAEYYQAPQPTEVRVGDVVTWDIPEHTYVVKKGMRIFEYAHGSDDLTEFANLEKAKIIDDSREVTE